MKKIIILAFCLFLIGSLATSCTEEEVQPKNAEGNITGVWTIGKSITYS